MSEFNLLVFGCVVSFIAVGGAYVYLREAMEGGEQRDESQAPQSDVGGCNIRDVA